MNCPFAFSEPSLIFVPGNLDQIPIRVPEVNRADGARGAGALHGSEFAKKPKANQGIVIFDFPPSAGWC